MPLLHEKRGNVVILTMSRPDMRNAWGKDYDTGLVELLDEFERDPDVRCVILTGDETGKAFSAGADVKNEKTHVISAPVEFIETMPTRRRFHPFLLLSEFPKPLIAAVNGYAIGIGCIASYCCDLIVASERAEWRLTQVNFGVIPAQGASARLSQWIGKGRAMRLAMGFPLKAEEAHHIGLAQWLVPHEKLMEEAMMVAEHIAGLPPLAARLAKESLNLGSNAAVLPTSYADLYRTMALQLSEDTLETHKAWREKRAPVLKGR